MAKTIGQLTQATTIGGADELVIEQGGLTKRIAASVVRGGLVNADIDAAAAIASSKLAQPLTLATAQATTSGTSIDFTGIPSWVKRITVMLSSVSTNGTAGLAIQLGTSGGIVSSGYAGGVSVLTTINQNSSSFFVFNSGSAADSVHGAIILTRLTGNSWIELGNLAQADNGAVRVSAGAVSLGGEITTVRLTTANGTDTFDAGSANIMYEG